MTAEDEGLHISFAGEAFDSEERILRELAGYTLEMTYMGTSVDEYRTRDIVLDEQPVEEMPDHTIVLRYRMFDDMTGGAADEPVRRCAYDIVKKLRVY